MPKPLALDLDGITVETLTPEPAAETTLESLATGHGMEEMSASILPAWCCSCPCCCCC
jgi:hypothetical protein